MQVAATSIIQTICTKNCENYFLVAHGNLDL